MTKKEIIKLKEKWQDKLNLNHWDIDIVFKKIPYKGKESYLSPAAMTNADSEYLDATIIISPDIIKFFKEEYLIYELLHICISEIRGYVAANKLDDKWFKYFEERLVSQLTNVIKKL